MFIVTSHWQKNVEHQRLTFNIIDGNISVQYMDPAGSGSSLNPVILDLAGSGSRLDPQYPLDIRPDPGPDPVHH